MVVTEMETYVKEKVTNADNPGPKPLSSKLYATIYVHSR
jgi:hypothetical protein